MGNPFVVAKFGGTSVKDFEAIERSANIVLSQPNTRVVVVSAQAGVTNRLVQIAKASLSASPVESLIQEIRDIVEPILNQLDQADCTDKVTRFLDDLNILANMLSRAYSQQLSDELLSFGERISSQLMVAMLKRLGANSEFVSSTDLIRTDSNYGYAKPQIESTQSQVEQNLVPLLESNIVVTEGFLGANREGVRTTLGRGGSDYSAAILAEALEAQALMIWTDVAGIYETDPRIVPSAKPIELISFNEAAELATFGAKVLHPASLWPAVRQNIDVFVGSSRNPEQKGTWIKASVEGEVPIVRALALRQNQTLLTVKSLQMLHAQGFLANIFSILAKHEISVDLVTTSEVSVALTLDSTASQSLGDALLTDEVIKELEGIGNTRVTVETGLSLVGVIGNGLDGRSGIGAQLFTSLDDINIRLICHGASSNNVCFLVDEAQAADAIASVYHTFFEKAEVLS